MKINFRIQNANGTFYNAGTGLNSWFTLEDARKTFNPDNGQKIVEICRHTEDILWEVCTTPLREKNSISKNDKQMYK